MHPARLLLLPATLLVGCDQHWYASDAADLDVAISGAALIDAQITTAPEAWPDAEIDDAALRVMLADQRVDFIGEVRNNVVITDHNDIDDHWGDNVNVLDAWDGCSVSETCERTFRFRLSCAEGDACTGQVSADTFLSTREIGLNLPTGSGLSLSLHLVER